MSYRQDEQIIVSVDQGLKQEVDSLSAQLAQNAKKVEDSSNSAILNEFTPRKHNAFPDAVWNEIYKKYFVVFRGGETHVEPTGAIYLIESTDGKVWTEPIKIIDTVLDDRDPSVYVFDNGDMLLSFFQYDNSSGVTGKIFTSKSTNGGLTWTAPVQATQSTTDFTTAPIVKAPNGNLVLPSYGNGQIRVYSSFDNGVTWGAPVIISISSGLSPSEPHIHVASDGRLICFIRTDSTVISEIYYSISNDNGVTWTSAVSLGLEGKQSGSIEKDGFIYIGVRVVNNYVYFGEAFIYKLNSSDLSLVDKFKIDNSFDGDVAYFSFSSKDNKEMVIAYYVKLPESASKVRVIYTNFGLFEGKKKLINAEHSLNSHNKPFILVDNTNAHAVLKVIQEHALGKFFTLVDKNGNVVADIGQTTNSDPTKAAHLKISTNTNSSLYLQPAGGGRVIYFGQNDGEVNSIGTFVWRNAMDIRGVATHYNLRAYRIPNDNTSGAVNVALRESGLTANRPIGSIPTGYEYYDTTLQKPIWYNGSVWKDATGATV